MVLINLQLVWHSLQIQNSDAVFKLATKIMASLPATSWGAVMLELATKIIHLLKASLVECMLHHVVLSA